mmetsp:Transcript_41327/g.101993  ORF Transcript_41327/g.101993 Transcript_41327/m.101993 type:complete len:394 (+) Transcript_41327:529-1710(+)
MGGVESALDVRWTSASRSDLRSRAAASTMERASASARASAAEGGSAAAALKSIPSDLARLRVSAEIRSWASSSSSVASAARVAAPSSANAANSHVPMPCGPCVPATAARSRAGASDHCSTDTPSITPSARSLPTTSAARCAHDVQNWHAAFTARSRVTESVTTARSNGSKRASTLSKCVSDLCPSCSAHCTVSSTAIFEATRSVFNQPKTDSIDAFALICATRFEAASHAAESPAPSDASRPMFMLAAREGGAPGPNANAGIGLGGMQAISAVPAPPWPPLAFDTASETLSWYERRRQRSNTALTSPCTARRFSGPLADRPAFAASSRLPQGSANWRSSKPKCPSWNPSQPATASKAAGSSLGAAASRAVAAFSRARGRACIGPRHRWTNRVQ